jgi:hypothetical protein
MLFSFADKTHRPAWRPGGVSRLVDAPREMAAQDAPTCWRVGQLGLVPVNHFTNLGDRKAPQTVVMSLTVALAVFI